MASPPWLSGCLRALTLAPGILPLGMLFGAAAAQVGFSLPATMALSALVFAGGAQFAAVGLAAAGASAWAVILLVALINSRYFLLSVATLDLARRVGATPLQRALLALGVVDESFALQSALRAEGDARDERDEEAGSRVGRQRIHVATLIAIPATLWLIWVASTAAGAVLGERLPPLEPYGLDYALPGIFVGLLGIFAQTREHLLVGLVALGIAGILALAGQATLAVLVVPPILAFAYGRWRFFARGTRLDDDSSGENGGRT